MLCEADAGVFLEQSTRMPQRQMHFGGTHAQTHRVLVKSRVKQRECLTHTRIGEDMVLTGARTAPQRIHASINQRNGVGTPRLPKGSRAVQARNVSVRLTLATTFLSERRRAMTAAIKPRIIKRSGAVATSGTAA